ncbi:Hypothetical protein NGAL_HAMBI1146_50830 [Neorhizobium galegae bv. officinalis]|nr:Hypothetical protein NGAL_HAMBI1146_50830 [Neorhizobium galegae bv. officinalis]
MNVRDDPSPSSDDLEGWREVVRNGSLRQHKLEHLAAAVRTLGPAADKRVREPLANRISEALMGMLRKRVGYNHRNSGWDIIERVHEEMIDALLDPQSADGEALTEAFSARVSFRIKDAIAKEDRLARTPGEGEGKTADIDPGPDKRADPPEPDDRKDVLPSADSDDASLTTNELDGRDSSFPADCRAEPIHEDDDVFESGAARNPDLMNGVRLLEETIDVERILATIEDERKRLAFRLHMDLVPKHRNDGQFSIAKALGVDRKTVGKWISEIQGQLSQNDAVKLLENSSGGGRR